MKRNFFGLSLATLAATAMVSCSSAQQPQLEDTSWQLVEIYHKPFDKSAIGKDNYTIAFTKNDDGLQIVKGTGDCSPFWYPVSINPERREIRNAYVRLKRGKCDNFQLEDTFVSVLQDADFYEVKGEELELFDGRLKTAKLKRIK